MDPRESFKEALQGLEKLYLQLFWEQGSPQREDPTGLLRRIAAYLERRPDPEEAVLVGLYLERALELLEEEDLPF